MKILEVREGFIKFQAEQNTALSSFVKIEEAEKTYIAQVIQLNTSIDTTIAYAKILFIYNDNIERYDNSIPQIKSEVLPLSYDFLQSLNTPLEPVIVGKMQDDSTNIIIDASACANKMIFCVDNFSEKNILSKNFAKQFNNIGKNILIIDTIGDIDAKKYTAGVDFKLPLNKASLKFMYEDCLNDATADSKSMIIEIFKDLSEYSETVPFVPFDTLKSIVDDMVDKSHIFKLLVLKNKLTKFDKMKYFATKKSEVDKLYNILNSKCAIIDISKLDSVFQNRYLSFIYENLNELNNTQVLLNLSNIISKKVLKNILISNKTKTAIFTHSQYKYLNEIAGVFDNYIITPSKFNNQIFNTYSTFLNTMNKGTCLLVGATTSYIPLVFKIENIDEKIELTFSKQETPNINENTQPEIDTENDDNKNDEEVTEIEQTIEQETDNYTYEEPDEISLDINSKTDAVIVEVSQTIEQPTSLNLFKDEEDNSENDIQEQENYDISLLEENIQKTDNDTVPEQNEDNSIILIDNDNLASDDLNIIEQNDDDDNNSTEEFETIQNNSDTELAEISDETDYIQDIQDTNDINISTDDFTDASDIEDYEKLEIIDSNENNIDEPEIKLDNNIDVENIKIVSGDLDLEDSPLESIAEETDTEIELSSDIDLDLSDEDNETNESVLTEENEQEYTEQNNDEQNHDNNNTEYISPDDFVEIDSSEVSPDDILVDLEENTDGISGYEAEEQIIKDVDKVYTTKIEDELSDTDLDLIDQLNEEDELLIEDNDDDTLLEEITESQDEGIIDNYQEEQPETQADTEPEILETKSATTPIVPVYDADIPQEDLVMSDPIQQGDTVTHIKYGNGVVEKMIKYGNKTLCAINFDNVGRRLLDPSLAEIKKC